VLVRAYVTDRLRAEIANGPRGTNAALACVLRVSSAHLSNLTRSPPSRRLGVDVRDKLLEHWGITLAQVEAISGANGRAHDPDPTFHSLLAAVALRPGLQAELLKPNTFRVSTVVRVATSTWETPDGSPRKGWRRALEAAEAGEGT
jgi:hypothetical protein